MLLAKLTSRWSHVAGGRHSHAADSGTLCVVADHTAVAQRASGLDRSEPTGRRQGAPRIGRLDFVRRMPRWNLDLGTGRRERTTTRLSRGFGFLFVVRTLSQTHGQGTKEASRRYATGDHSSGSAVSDKNVTARHEAYGARPSLGLGNVRAGTTRSVSDNSINSSCSRAPRLALARRPRVALAGEPRPERYASSHRQSHPIGRALRLCRSQPHRQLWGTGHRRAPVCPATRPRLPRRGLVESHLRGRRPTVRSRASENSPWPETDRLR